MLLSLSPHLRLAKNKVARRPKQNLISAYNFYERLPYPRICRRLLRPAAKSLYLRLGDCYCRGRVGACSPVHRPRGAGQGVEVASLATHPALPPPVLRVGATWAGPCSAFFPWAGGCPLAAACLLAGRAAAHLVLATSCARPCGCSHLATSCGRSCSCRPGARHERRSCRRSPAAAHHEPAPWLAPVVASLPPAGCCPWPAGAVPGLATAACSAGARPAGGRRFFTPLKREKNSSKCVNLLSCPWHQSGFAPLTFAGRLRVVSL